MIDFVGRSRSPLDDMQQWNQYFGQDAARAQADWQNREIRNRYNEAARYNREGAISDTQFINSADVADNFQGMDSQLAGLRPEGAPAAHIASAAGSGTGANPATGTGTSAAPGTYSVDSANPLMRGRNPNRPSAVTVGGPISLGSLTREERAAVDAYVEAAGGHRDLITGRQPRQPNQQAIQVAQERLRHFGLEYRAGSSGNGANTPSGIYRVTGAPGDNGVRFPGTSTPAAPGSPSATAAIPPAFDLGDTPGGAASVDLGAPATLNDNPNADANSGGLEPPTGYQGTNDTSRGLVPTREMRMLQTNIQDSLRRADIAARHGDRAGAQAALAQAMQGQAAYITQGRTVLYRAAAAGSLNAMSTLLAEFNGYPAGTVRLQPTDERRTRFLMQVQRNDGTWVTASETPHTRNEILGGLQNLIDVEGATARTEANTELMRAQIAAGAQITVASINYRGQLMHELTEAQKAMLDSRTRIALQRGEGQMLVNSQDGSVWLRYSDTDANGNTVQRTEVIRDQDVPTPDTNGHRTTRMPVRTRVTGTTGVSPNEGATP